MKVQYLKDFTDESVAPGFVFKKGWTAEHSDAIGQQRIESGDCIQVDNEARARRSNAVMLDCAEPETKNTLKK